MGYAHACGTWTPALPKPIPAMVAASIISARASVSAPSATARRRKRPPLSIAFELHMSAIGFEPW